MAKKIIRYATKSRFKRDEMNELASMKIRRGVNDIRVDDAFAFEYFDSELEEPLERDLSEMVRHKVRSAYKSIQQPCVAEHAGLICEAYKDKSFPGGLTQPMWDAIGAENFAKGLAWAGNRMIARAVVAYCDGKKIYTFAADTLGVLSEKPRGKRDFYWDTLFVPDGGGGKTYLQIASEDGIAEKLRHSQSTKAMRNLFEFLLVHKNDLFD